MSGHIIVRGGKTEGGQFAKASQLVMMDLVKRCAEKLQEHYPNHIWSVAAGRDHSIIAIKCLNVDDHYGYVLHTKNVQEDPNLKCVVLAGGEILERGNQQRRQWDGKPSETLDLTGAKQIRLNDQKNLIKKVIR